MDLHNYLYDSIYIKTTQTRGRGVFTSRSLKEGQVIEISPVIVLSGNDRSYLDKTLLHDYIFEWGADQKECCMALGYVSLYNHSYEANCEYEMNFKKQLIAIRTVRPVKRWEELFINYNGEWNNQKKVWFDEKIKP